MGRAYHHGDLRNALVEAAEEMLSEQPVDAFSLREAAKRVGVSPNAPYRHFADKDELLASVAARGFEELARRFGELPPVKPKARFIQLVEAYVAFALERPSCFRLMFGGRFVSFDQYPELTRASSLALDGLVRIVWPLVDEPTHLNVMHAAVAVWSSAHGYATLSIDGALPVSEGARPTAKELGHFLLDGIRKAKG